MTEVALGELAARLGGELIGDPAQSIDRIATLEAASPTSIAFLANPRYQAQLATTRAACVIVAPAFREAAAVRGAAIVIDDPYLAFARLTQWWAERTRQAPPVGIHASAVVDVTAEVAPDASVGPFVVVGAGARIGAGAAIGAHGVIGTDASVGAGTRLAPRVTLGDGCSIGERGIVHSGVVIGADGFGFAPDRGAWQKIEQLGAVRIGNDVEIGANTCIDRGALDDTVIADGVKLDNLIQIGHNVRIGEHTAIAGCAAIAGSAVIGAHCMIGGGAAIAGHVTLADHVTVSGATSITHSITKPGHYSGVFPFDDNASWEKNAVTLRQLYALRNRVRALERGAETNQQ
ncbi:UDP-3-O-(3-hydroxymyristoyl)glucosamine N-acyltransferase [Piscinibacter koreensis]|uniref:UDP-3-O-acylglucosamine N-acyltransferase n=1 Tax=Piscinibacter koreensis TaxID=2742824 RepID=A0A7Y6NNA3_9BURK|nr:UDP-3-O-(3-hydroxymyristoyl)glucosamine N-acyltransferase [Schlegelella koreensis]